MFLVKFLLTEHVCLDEQWLSIIQVLEINEDRVGFYQKLANGMEFLFAYRPMIDTTHIVFPNLQENVPVILSSTEVDWETLKASFEILVCENPNPNQGDIIKVYDYPEETYTEGRFIAYDNRNTRPWVVEIKEHNKIYIERFAHQKQKGEIRRRGDVYSVFV